MVPDRFENCATAHLIAFKQRKLRMVGGKPISANSGTLTSVEWTETETENKQVTRGHDIVVDWWALGRAM